VNFEICAEEGAGNWEGPRVEGLVRQAIEHLGGIDDDRSLWRVVDLAIVLYRQRRYEEAEHYGAIAVTRYLDLGAEVYAVWGMTWLAQIHVQRGDMGKARDLLLILASIARRVRSTQNESSVFWVAMPLALDAGLPLLAARAYGALTHGTYATTSGLHSTVRITAEEWLARAARGRSSVEIELAVREGAEEDPVRLVELIEEQLRSRRAPGARATTPALRHGELTPREVEVLSLVGAGRSDGDIAAELFISPKTASVHVSNVKAKLGVDSRLEMALRARDMGLVRA
jgi:DNA-binding CsgD family transcriptional regulator